MGVLVTGGFLCGCEVEQPTPAADPSPVVSASKDVQNTGKTNDRSPSDRQSFSAAKLAEIQAAVVRIDVNTESGAVVGSGFLVDKKGLVVTSDSIVRDARSALVTFSNGTLHPVEGTLARRPECDLAILKIPAPQGVSRALPMAVADPRPGEPVVAFGYSGTGPESASEGTVTQFGVSSGPLDGAASSQTVQIVHTDAVVSKENHGGPLVNSRGLVVGVNTLAGSAEGSAYRAVASTEVLQGIAGATVSSVVPFADETTGPAPDPPRSSPISPALNAKIVRALEAHRQEWLWDFAEELKTRREQIQVLETEIRTKQALIDTVKGGGSKAIETMKRFPVSRSRIEWLRMARDYVDSLQEQVDEEQSDLEEDQTLLDRELYPPPTLMLHRLAIGRFGLIRTYGRVSQILEDGTFLAYFEGDVQLHCRGFDLDNLVDDKLFRLSMMCIISGNYSYTTVTGARRTVFTLEPLDLTVLPEQYQQAMQARMDYFEAKHAQELDEWEARVEKSRTLVDQGGDLPRLGTRFEPETLIDLLSGDARIKPPPLPRRFQVNRRLESRVDPVTGMRWSRVVKQRVETEESKAWRRRQLVEFEGRKAVYPAYALDDFLNELTNWTADFELIYNVDNRLQKDVDQLAAVAFERYGLTPGNRVQDVPWTPEDREKLISLLTEMAIQYGEVSDEATVDASETVDDPDETEAERAAERIEVLKSKIRRKRILLRNIETIDPRHQTFEKQLRELEAELEAAEKVSSEGEASDDSTDDATEMQ